MNEKWSFTATRIFRFFTTLIAKHFVVVVTLITLTIINLGISFIIVEKGFPDSLKGFKFYLIFWFIFTAFTGIFPVSYFAYLFYQKDKPNSKRIRNELKLLGLVTDEEYNNFDELYRTFNAPLQFGYFIVLLEIICNIILATYFVAKNSTFSFITSTQVTIIFYAFLGAYLYGVRLVVRRYNTLDLQPQVYASITLRIIVSITLAFGISSLIALPTDFTGVTQAVSGTGNGTAEVGAILPTEEAAASNTGENQTSNTQDKSDARELLPLKILAFLIGVFPEQGLRWLVVVSRRAFRDSSLHQFNERSLRKIVGINEWHEARLEQIGIDDAQSLATADLSKLLLTTQFDAMQVINWVDQAILYMKVGSRIDQFLAFQITTYHELYGLLHRIKLSTYREHDQDSVDHTSNNKSNIDLTDNNYNKLLIALGFTFADLERLCDYSNYPNYIRIQEYYRNLDNVTREQAKRGAEEIIGSVELGGEILSDSNTNPVETLSNEEVSKIQNNIYDLRSQLSYTLSERSRVEMMLSLGKLLYLISELKESLKTFDQCLTGAAANTLNHSTKAKAYVWRGLVNIILGNQYRDGSQQNDHQEENILLAQKHYQNAISDNNMASRLDPSNVAAFNNCAIAYMEQENFDLALESLEKALWFNPRSGVAYYNRGTIRNTIGKSEKDFAEADLDFERSHLLGYQPYALWSTWGLTLVNLGRYQDAISHLSKAISFSENNFLLYSRRAFAYLQLSEDAKENRSIHTAQAYARLATSDFERAIDLNQDHEGLSQARLYINYGHLKVVENAYEQAIESYEKARTIHQGFDRDTTFNHNLGNAYFYKGERAREVEENAQEDYRKAIERYGIAIKQNTSVLGTYYHSALAHFRLEQFNDAKAQALQCRQKVKEVKGKVGYNVDTAKLNSLETYVEELIDKVDDASADLV